jgi:exodeoxyribonuclease V beta subunit
MSLKTQIAFDALQVELEGSNLIEASAGTGKTYSIAVLVLRMIVEKGISIRDILMVTFTNAAVAELEERVRLFLRSALRAAEGLPVRDLNIVGLVEAAAMDQGKDIVLQRLQDAVLFLDEASIMTIHSFCQNVLNEFAFETQQLFGMELQANADVLIEEELNQFWRRHITTLPKSLLILLGDSAFKDWLFSRLKMHFSGKRYVCFDADKTYTFTDDETAVWETKIELAQSRLKEVDAAMEHRFELDKHNLAARCTKGYAAKNFGEAVKEYRSFIETLEEKRTAKYVQETFPDWLQELEQYEAAAEESDNLGHELRKELVCFALQECSQAVVQIRQRRNLLSYDDLIRNLHKVLVDQPNEALEAALRGKYKAVFVDEFQDTDRLQYEIFDRAFSRETILFYIGDPKQSIYAFRKADVFTYLKAKDSVNRLFGMNKSFRSSEPLINALNKFFLPKENFDTFHFGESLAGIRFHPVESPNPNSKGLLWKDGEPEVPVSIHSCAKNEDVQDAVVSQVFEMLVTDRYQLGPEGAKRNVKPSDIGILVRTGAKGRELRNALGILGVPAVCVDDTRILASEEAKALYYLLEAIAEPNRGSINRAIRSPFTAYTTSEILSLDEEVVLAEFLRCRERWHKHGVYSAIMAFANAFGVREHLLNGGSGNGERSLTNLFQLAEILHNVQSRRDLSMTELISWLQRGIEGANVEGDEYEQRVESDEDAVRIVTIHKSKGLEYPIVLAPELDFRTKRKDNADLFGYRDPNSSEYVFVDMNLADEQQESWRVEQEEQENRRLLYVALTRAVYKCYMYPSQWSGNANSTLRQFLTAQSDSEFIRNEEGAAPEPKGRFSGNASRWAEAPRVAESFRLLQRGWHRMSFSSLRAPFEFSPKPRFQGSDDAYEQFVMSELRPGVKTGELLHYMLERATFGEDANWDNVIESALQRFAPGREEHWLPMLRKLLGQVFDVEISVGGNRFRLADVNWNKRIHEFEFDFPVAPFHTDMLESLSDLSTPLKLRYSEIGAPALEGIMNGKMDLFFEHDGRYYILDWKSNYLGGTLDFYSRERLKEVMDEEGYHLQYLIYTVPAKKYLELRIPDFDYETQFGGVIYLFLRGMRQGRDAGIFTDKPEVGKIEMMEKLFRSVNS